MVENKKEIDIHRTYKSLKNHGLIIWLSIYVLFVVENCEGSTCSVGLFFGIPPYLLIAVPMVFLIAHIVLSAVGAKKFFQNMNPQMTITLTKRKHGLVIGMGILFNALVSNLFFVTIVIHIVTF